MRLGFAFDAALALGFLTATSDAFTVTAFTRSQTSASIRVGMVGSGWDNDDFLASLSNGGSSSSSSSSNRSEDSEGDSKVTKELEGSMGGSRWAEMMARARRTDPRPLVNPYTPNPIASSSSSQTPITPYSPPSIPIAAATASVDLNKLTTEEQAALFRQFMSNVPAGIPPPGADASPRTKVLPGGLAADGRKVGRNRDADTIANTSDLYFAQLKRDSTVRTIARYQGDLDAADAIFEDPTVQELATQLTTNPYLQRDDTPEELALMDTVAEELAIIRSSLKATPAVDVTTAGMSYKEKLKAKQAGKNMVAPKPAPTVQQIVEIPLAPVLPLPPPPPPVVQQVVEPPPAELLPPPDVLSQQVAPVLVARAARTADDSRQDIRMLQGLLLKHRGGSGFGSGLLRGDEVNKFETTLEDVITCLRGEADSVPTLAPPSVVVAAPPMSFVSPSIASPSDVTNALSKMGPTLACVEGAVLMYKNSPVEMQSIMVPTLRAALLAAVTTCTTVIGDDSAPPSVALDVADAGKRMVPTLACVEGAVQMYKNSPPELQPTMVMTIRAALVAAVTTCDQLLGGMSLPPTAVTTIPAVDVAAATPETVVTTTPMYSGNDANSQFLQGVYKSLVAASGSEKYGLKNLSPSEASKLADQVHEMKGMLADELGSGIPDSPLPVSSTSTGTTSSRYQEMLAKARAEKAIGN